MNAAFLAAASGEPVGMAHLARAVRAEGAKADKPVAFADVADWR
jgi:hypothetical protein